jgi:hypothetical protein
MAQKTSVIKMPQNRHDVVHQARLPTACREEDPGEDEEWSPVGSGQAELIAVEFEELTR